MYWKNNKVKIKCLEGAREERKKFKNKKRRLHVPTVYAPWIPYEFFLRVLWLNPLVCILQPKLKKLLTVQLVVSLTIVPLIFFSIVTCPLLTTIACPFIAIAHLNCLSLGYYCMFDLFWTQLYDIVIAFVLYDFATLLPPYAPLSPVPYYSLLQLYNDIIIVHPVVICFDSSQQIHCCTVHFNPHILIVWNSLLFFPVLVWLVYPTISRTLYIVQTSLFFWLYWVNISSNKIKLELNDSWFAMGFWLSSKWVYS